MSTVIVTHFSGLVVNLAPISTNVWMCTIRNERAMFIKIHVFLLVRCFD